MEVVKTLMIIQSLVMGVTMAYKVLGVSKRDHFLKSLNRAELNEDISEDKPDVRRKLTRDASRISMDDTFYYESPCTTEVVTFHAVKYFGIYKFVSEKSFLGVQCKEGESVNIGNTQHKVCNPEQSPHMYCYTKTKSLWTKEVSFKVFKKNDEGDWVYRTTTPKSTYIEFVVGCDCGWQRHIAGDSNENRAGEQ